MGYLRIISEKYKGNNPEVHARILGGQARNYLKLGYYRSAIQFWENAIKIIENSNNKPYLKAIFRNNMSLAYLNLGETERAHQNLLQSLEEFPLVQTHQKLSDLVLDKNKDFELSKAYLASGLAMINDSLAKTKIYVNKIYTRKLNLAYITEGFAYHYYIKNDLETSLEKYQEVLSIAENLKRVSLRLEMLKTLGFLYQEIGNLEKSTYYFAKHIGLNDSLRITINNSLSTPARPFFEEKVAELIPMERGISPNVKIFILLLISMTLVLILYFFRKERVGTQEANVEKKLRTSNKEKSNDLILSQRTEDNILEKLSEFEASEEFLNKDMSASILIGRLNTNNKYFRQILKKYKKKDYNTYINELRINYIMDKLKNNPEYLDYKISYLAEESGFSSHSKFSADFKKVVKCSPSEIIEKIKAKKSPF